MGRENQPAKTNAKAQDANDFDFDDRLRGLCRSLVCSRFDSTHGGLALHSMLGLCCCRLLPVKLLFQQLTLENNGKGISLRQVASFLSTHSQICSRSPISCLVTCLGLPHNSWPITRTRHHQPLPEVRQSSSCIPSHQP